MSQSHDLPCLNLFGKNKQTNKKLRDAKEKKNFLLIGAVKRRNELVMSVSLLKVFTTTRVSHLFGY